MSRSAWCQVVALACLASFVSFALPARALETAPPDVPRVSLVVVGQDGTVVERRRGSSMWDLAERAGERWDLVCVAPCGGLVPIGTYRLGVGRSAHKFTLEEPSTVEIRPRSGARIAIGASLVGAGGIALICALASALGDRTFAMVGFGAGGAIGIAVGIPLLVSGREKAVVTPVFAF